MSITRKRTIDCNRAMTAKADIIFVYDFLSGVGDKSEELYFIERYCSNAKRCSSHEVVHLCPMLDLSDNQL